MAVNYTLVKSLSTRIPSRARLVHAAPSWADLGAALQIPTDLASRHVGEPVTESRSSWVRRAHVGRVEIYLKTYEFASWRARLRSFGRRTAPWCKSRAQREFEALTWLRANHFPAPEPLAVLEVRRLGFLVRALVATAAFPGQPASQLLPTLPPAAQAELAAAVGALVGRLHAAGFRDRNLDLRNLIVDARGGAFRIAKIDSGRFRIVAPGAPDDALARADWDRLLPQLPTGLASIARRAGAEASR